MTGAALRGARPVPALAEGPVSDAPTVSHPGSASTSAAAASAADEAERAAESDEALMLRVGRGDRAAFAQLVARHTRRVHGLAMRLCANGADAEEVAQDAFTRIWTHAARWQPRDSERGARVSTWLYRIVLNLCIDRGRRRPLQPMDDVPEPPDPADDALTGLHRAQIRARVAEAVAGLPERQRLALTLCVFEGMSNAEAGAVLELSVGGVESLLVRARRALRLRLQDLAGPL